jgi:hypothetical protein
MKPTTTKSSEKSERPTATDTLVSISELVLKFRGEEKPNLATVARTANRASGLLRIKDLDEKDGSRECRDDPDREEARLDELTNKDFQKTRRGRNLLGCGPKSMKNPECWCRSDLHSRECLRNAIWYV